MAPGATSRQGTGDMLFIVSSGAEKVDSSTRKLIRSHVMRGKKQKTKKTTHRKPVDHDGRRTSERTHHARQAMSVKLDDVVEMYYASLIPARVGSDLSFVEFPGEVEPSLLMNMIKFSDMATKIAFPLMAAIGFQADHHDTVQPFASDAAAMHMMAFAVEGFIDKVMRRQETGHAAMLHFHKGLRLLQGRLSGIDDAPKISDSTIWVVWKLACAAHVEGDYAGAKKHLDGLRKMVDLRGGLVVFTGLKLLAEILRCDLSVALLNGAEPIFFRQPEEPLPPYPEALVKISESETCARDNSELLSALDPGLAMACLIMRRFSKLVSLGTQTHRTLDPQFICETMAAVMYRLLQMRFTDKSFDETVRLGLLAFSHHVFLQWRDIRLPYDHFPSVYKICILQFQPYDMMSAHLSLWLSMVAAISLFDVSEHEWLLDHLREQAEKCQVKTWEQTHGILKSLMWIALLDDMPGRTVFHLLALETDDPQDTARGLTSPDFGTSTCRWISFSESRSADTSAP